MEPPAGIGIEITYILLAISNSHFAGGIGGRHCNRNRQNLSEFRAPRKLCSLLSYLPPPRVVNTGAVNTPDGFGGFRCQVAYLETACVVNTAAALGTGNAVSS